MAKRKSTNNGPQNTVCRTLKIEQHEPLKTDGDLKCSGRVAVPALLVAPVVLLLLQVW
jgi:hypothetical protein